MTQITLSIRLALLTTLLLSLVRPTLQITEYDADPTSCQIHGDGDVYGIGVRLGYYFSWVSGLIAVILNNRRAVRDTRRGVILISLAVFVITIKNTLDGGFAALEWSIVFPMAIWAPLFVLLVPAFGDSEDPPGAIALFALGGTVLVVHPWVWFTRVQQGRREGCDVDTFVLRYFDMYNSHWIGFQRFVAVGYCLVGVFLILYAGVKTWMYLRERNIGRSSPTDNRPGLASSNASPTPGRPPTHAFFPGHSLPDPPGWGDTRSTASSEINPWVSGNIVMDERAYNQFMQDFDKMLPGIHGLFRAFFKLSRLIGLAPMGIFTIAFSEMIIAGNDIDLSESPLLSSGQLIPFIVGLAGLLSTIWSVTVGRYIEKKTAARAGDADGNKNGHEDESNVREMEDVGKGQTVTSMKPRSEPGIGGPRAYATRASSEINQV
ncbi:hypothetical protein BDW74DRAFT_172636 [Aspergillus multicolor]|uniref:uncharacterized protein n=1 Tax=Aspergillus multicolor TaxID=41759 RepID=UPI003CCD2E92